MLDVDNFKRHNDTFGHQHGDEVLRSLAACMQSELRPTDCIARYGGKEFAIVAPNTSLEGALRLANRLLQAVRAASVDDQKLTISIGICELSDEVADTTSLLSRADQALFLAKRQGKDRVVAWGAQVA